MKLDANNFAMRHRARTASGAFTLIEVLLAMAILGFIITAIYSSWTAILRSAETGNRAAAVAQKQRVARRAIEDALSSVQFFEPNARYYSFFAESSGDFATLSFVSRLPVWFPGSGMFPPTAPRRVSFVVENTGNGKNRLLMQQMPILAPTNSMEKPYTIELSDSVRLFMVEFWDGKQNDWVTDWELTNQLPALVRVALAFGDSHARLLPTDVMSSVVSLTAASVSAGVQMPAPPGGGPGPKAGNPNSPFGGKKN